MVTRLDALNEMSAFFENNRDMAYSKLRNFDNGQGSHRDVSLMSKYTRYRIILESELADRTKKSSKKHDNEKYMKEVFWRTYWKGYLENKPSIWDDYIGRCSEPLSDDISDQLKRALHGETDIECFNYWVAELKETGYLHNHARMWFAGIWIHSLKLPWYLGAKFFLEHLIDGDEAVNTLSWRWVAGIHTKGKFYLARASNIKKFTRERFDPKNISQSHIIPDDTYHDFALVNDYKNVASEGRTALLVTIDDLSPGVADSLDSNSFDKVYILNPSYRACSDVVKQFQDAAIKDTADRLGKTWNACVEVIDSLDQIEDLSLVAAYRPNIGHTLDFVKSSEQEIEWLRRTWDVALWPFATASFFKFYKGAMKKLKATV